MANSGRSFGKDEADIKINLLDVKSQSTCRLRAATGPTVQSATLHNDLNPEPPSLLTMAQRLAAVLRIFDCYNGFPAQDKRLHHPAPFPLEAVLGDDPVVKIRQFRRELRRILHGDCEANTMRFACERTIVAKLMSARDLKAFILLKIINIINLNGEETLLATKPKTCAGDRQHCLYLPDI